MIAKDKSIVCDSCHKNIVGEVNTVMSMTTNWGKTRKPTHFHPTPRDCADAVETVLIVHKRNRKREDD